MRWRDLRQSSNVEDRRGRGGLAIGGGLGGLVIAFIVYLLGGNPSDIPQSGPVGGGADQGAYVAPGDDSLKQFVSAVLASTEDVWTKRFREMGKRYIDPRLVLFTSQVQSACGIAGAATGPFYCPNDQQIYIDLSFYRELKERFGAPGDFAQAYVIAHEVGHHVQNMLGIFDRAEAQGVSDRTGANSTSVKLELQADFLAGVWAHDAQGLGLLEAGDIEEALNAANAIGDDRLQQETQGRVVPDAFTHGTSAQRMAWFKRGFETGDLKYGDTFQDGP
jgi:predicted metalloprotease